MYKKGDKVLYAGTDKGIVKINQEDKHTVFVVYSCGNDWKNYENFTAENSHIEFLTKGWAEKGTTEWCKENGGCDFTPNQSKWAPEGESICIYCDRKN